MSGGPFVRDVVRVDTSPMNRLRHCLTLSCGHKEWVAARSKPKRRSTRCSTCAAAGDARP